MKASPQGNTLMNFYITDMECYQSFHILHSILGGLFAVIFIGVIYLFIITSYEAKIFNTSFSAKTNSSFDQLIFLTKVILSIVNSFFGVKGNDWILIFFLCFFSFSLFYSYFFKHAYSKRSLHITYSLFVSVFAWTNIVLLLGKLTESSSFDGSIPLLLMGLPVIILIIAYEDIYQVSIIKYQLTYFEKPIQVMHHIKALLFLAKEKDSVRGARVILNGYIHQYETTCPIIQCPLKKYLLQIEQQREEAYSLLLYHIEYLYKVSASKFPTSIALKLSYSVFSFEYLNKKNQANSLLSAISHYSPSFEEQFTLYHILKKMEEHKANSETEDNLDVVSSVSYKNNFIQFKSTMTKITFLYIDFWTLLLVSFEHQEHLTALNDFGIRIIKLVEDLAKLLEKMQKVKPNDQELLYYYSDFLNSILNEKEKAQVYKSKLADIVEANEINDINYFNLDLDALSSSDEYQYLVISGSNESFGIITTISLGFCLLLGYSKAEIIGKSYDIIMPNILQKAHKRLLIDKVNAFKNEYDNITSYNSYTPSFKDIDAFSKTKARYLVHIPFQVTLIVTETHGISFIAKMNSEQLSNSTNQSSTCYLLTNNLFIVQNFTVNSVNLLGITSYALNDVLDITGLIKQLNEDFLQEALEKEDLTPEDKITIKRHLINQKYKTTKCINWKMNELILEQRFRTSKIQGDSSISEVNHKGIAQDSFFLTIMNISIAGKQEGYVFKLELSSPSTQLLGVSQPSKKELLTVLKRKMSDKTYLLLNSPNIELQFDKYKGFVPEGKSNFTLDTQKMSYTHNAKHKTDVKEDLKSKAIQKIQQRSIAKETTIIDEDNYQDTSSDVSDEDYTSSLDKASNKGPIIDKIASFKAKDYEKDEYYKVDFSRIKYSVYSYERQMVIEVTNYVKKTQLELKLLDEDKKEGKSSDNKETKQSSKSIDLFKDDDKAKNDLDQKELLKQQITTALAKEESQTIILLLQVVMIVILITFLAYEGCLYYILYDSRMSLVDTSTLIANTYKILMNFIISHSALRDLTLLSNENYTSFDETRQKAIASSLNIISGFYNNTVELINNLTINKAYLSAEEFFFFHNETTQVTIIKNDLNASQYQITLLSALSQANSVLFHIINDNKQYMPTDDYVFFFIENINNNLTIKIHNQATVFITSFFSLISVKLINFYALLSVSLIVEVIIFFAFTKTYQAVAKRKESYLEVFFEIGADVIRSSLEKCEHFARKIQLQTFTEFIVNDDEPEYYEQSSHKNKPQLQKKKKQIDFNKNSKETTLIKSLFCFFLAIVFIYRAIDIIFFYLFMDKLGIYIQIFLSENEAFIEYALLYRNCREFFYDDNIKVENINANEYFHGYMTNFYNDVIQKQNMSLLHKDYFPQKYLEEHNRRYYTELCTDKPEDQLLCSDETTRALSIHGLKIMLPFFVEEIRFMKGTKALRIKLFGDLGFKYNLTLTGLKEYNDLIPDNPELYENYFYISPLYYFNLNTYKRVRRIYNQFITPSFLSLFSIFEVCIREFIEINFIFFYVVSGLSILVLIVVYFFAWRPFETQLNSIIFKTKNLLSIIPKEFLASLANIHKLLNLNESFSKINPSIKKK